MNRSVLIAFVSLMYLFATGCATITRGTTEAFVVESEPPGATVTFSTGETCMTPCTLERRRKDGFVIDIVREGYEPVRVNIVSQTAGEGSLGFAGNVLIGGLIGMGIDAGSGATKELVPNPVRVNLVPLGYSPAETMGEAITEEIDEDMDAEMTEEMDDDTAEEAAEEDPIP